VRFEIEGFVRAERFRLDFSFANYLIAGAAAGAAATLAAFLPARRAARVDPVEIIRGAT
jgi:lipoprotein-releasing system permease protein